MSDEKTITGKTRESEVETYAVALFSGDMLKKLQKNSHKVHWSTVDNFTLLHRLKEELDELRVAVFDDEGSQAIIDECCDVALFAMFVADNIRKGEK